MGPRVHTGRLTVASTGLMTGECAVVPVLGCFKDSRLVVAEGTVPPSYLEYDLWPTGSDPHHDGFFLALYALIRHRPGIDTVAKAREWFLGHAIRTVKHLQYTTMSLLSDVKVALENLGGSVGTDPAAIDPDDAARIMGAPMFPVDILTLFVPETTGRDDIHRRRLLFLLNYWELESFERPEDMDVAAPVIELACGSVGHSSVGVLSLAERRHLVRLRRENACVYVQPPVLHGTATVPAIADFVELVYPGADPEAVDHCVAALRPLSLSMCKSLLQKLVRTGAAHVSLVGIGDGISVPSTLLMAALVIHMVPLSLFNPSGSGIESGVTALFKRTAIICYEDAWPAELADPSAAVEWLTVCAALGVARRRWIAPPDYLRRCFEILAAAHRSRTFCAYSHSGPASAAAEFPGKHPLDRSRFLFENFIGGMRGDMHMIGDVTRRLHASEKQLVELKTAATEAVLSEIPIYHFIDQHCATSFFYLLPPGGVAASMMITKLDSLSGVFGTMFSELTGLNPRRLSDHVTDLGTLTEIVPRTVDNVRLVTEFQNAQRQLWLSLVTDREANATHGDSTTQITVRKPYDYLASRMGSNRIRLNGVSYVWTLDPSDLTHINVTRTTERPPVRVPGLQAKEDDDDDGADTKPGKRPSKASMPKAKHVAKTLHGMAEEEEAELQAVRDRVTEQLHGAGFQIPSMGTLTLQPDESGIDAAFVNGVNWDHMRVRKITVPACRWGDSVLPSDSLLAPRRSIDTVQMAQRLANVVQNIDGITNAGKRFAFSQMRSPSCVISFPRALRDGTAASSGSGSQILHLHLEAWAICKAISDWSALLLCPGMGSSLCDFETAAEYLDLRVQIANWIIGQKWSTITPQQVDGSLVSCYDWFTRRRGLPLYQHQMFALRSLAYRITDGGHRAHFLWMDMGSGKTITALCFGALLQLLRTRDPDVMHCVFVTSPSAINAVRADMVALNLAVVQLDSKRASPLPRLDDFNVVLVTSDCVKNARVLTHVMNFASHALVIVDEVHMCAGVGTKRNSAMRLLADLAGQVLFMTATPLRSLREKKNLCAMLQHVANFPVLNDSDFIVASGAMIHPLLCDRIPREFIEMSAETEANRATLMGHLPARLGGNSMNEHLSAAALQLALRDSYEACDEFVIRLALDEIRAGNRPFVVCRTSAHRDVMLQRFINAGIGSNRIWCPAVNTIQSVVCGERHIYQVGLMPLANCTGYSATYFNVLVRSVFPSNESNREQMNGRLARTGQRSFPVRLITVHCGITSFILRGHIETSNTVQMIERLNLTRIEP